MGLKNLTYYIATYLVVFWGVPQLNGFYNLQKNIDCTSF